MGRILGFPRFVLPSALVAAVLTFAPSPAVRAQAPPRLLGGLSALDRALYEEAARLRLRFLPNQVLVKFKPGATRAGRQRALMALRSRPNVDTLRWAGPLAIVTDLGQWNAHILAQQLREQPEVEYAQPNYLRRVTATPNDPSYPSRQWNFDAIGMPAAWDINSGASGITVAIVDTGITNVSTTFLAPTWNGFQIVDILVPFAISPDLSASRLVKPWDFATELGATVLDTEGHGTHVGSTAGEDTNNNLMLAGIAHSASIMPVKVCLSYWDIQFSRSASGVPGYAPLDSGGCPDSATASGIRYAADNGAKVINFSIGGEEPDPAMEEAIRYAVGKGAFVAISAGNSYEGGNPVEYPAKYAESIDGAMAVGAVGRTLEHAYYSSSGSYVEIAAPGGDIRQGGNPGGVWQTTIRLSDSDPETVIFPRFDRYDERSFQGTSMASPHVAGVAALIMSQLGSAATPALVEELIKSTSRPCTETSCAAPASGPRERRDFFGAGLIQARTALFGRGVRR
jgi:serine protease